MTTKLLNELIDLADKLDRFDPKTADKIDELIKQAQNYPDWGEEQKSSKEYDLFHKYSLGEITKEQYIAELKKLKQQEQQQNKPVIQPQGKV